MNAETEQALESLWARIPDVQCKGKCAESCGPIAMSQAEFNLLRAYVGERIQGQPIEGGSVMVTNFNKQTFACPLLKDDRCSAYAQRPTVCRLWGAIKAMRCPWGCAPKAWLRDVDATEIMRQASQIEA